MIAAWYEENGSKKESIISISILAFLANFKKKINQF